MDKVYGVMDLFCGTGGFSKGFENLDIGKFRTIFGVDIIPASVETFKLNHKHAVGVCGDITKLPAEEISKKHKIYKKDVDVIIGGPPCQGFSSIRPNRNSNNDDKRNNLFWNFVEYVEFFKPSIVVMENVVGLATHNKGKTIQGIEKAFADSGYHVDWKILNAAHFGVPQRRERLILVGWRKGKKRFKFPAPKFYCDNPTIGIKDKSKMIIPTPEMGLPKAISAYEAISDLPPVGSGQEATKYTDKPIHPYQQERRKNTESLLLHKSTLHSPKMMEIIKHSGPNINCIPKHLISSGFSSCYSRIEKDIPSVTITVNFVHPASNKCIHPVQHRALTPREGARLQSFDDDFQFAGTRQNIIKQIGNAVPPLLGKSIGEAVLDYIE